MTARILVCGILICMMVAGSIAAAAPDTTNGWTENKTTLTYYGQSAFMLTHGDTRLVFDPWFTGNPWKAATAGEINCQYILVSHAHQDHLGDTVAIATRTGAKVITTSAIARMLKDQGCDVQPMDIGGKRMFDFGFVRVTPAMHGSGIAGGQAAGFVVNFYGTTIYFAGDTALFGDMALIAKQEKLDYALLPIGNNYTMGPEDALEAVGMLNPKMVIPMHYNSNPLIMQSPDEFKRAVESRFGIPTIVMQPGKTLVL
ncbi:MAG: metal-dependent hydrolase [Negativicutes bacterium]|nr:metal-dependent hydrolase [Negativicutes bacterium]